tara:strand:+ start:7224 stop:9806 length:2583 start_codon:yes stop_codon:yes gene_type:complete
MATDNPSSIKVPKATLYKMVSYKGSTGGKKYTPLQSADEMGKMQGDMGKGFQAVIGGINSLGASINSIALGVQSMTSSLKTSIGKQVKAANTIEKVQKEAIKADDDREREKIKNEQRQKKLEQRNQSEEDGEVGGKRGLFKNIGKAFKENTKKSFGGLFTGLVRLSTYFLKIVMGMAALTWIARNPEAIQRLAKTLATVGKFILNMSSFLAGNAFNGLIKFLENPISLKGLFGALQFVAAAAPLFATLAFLKNPRGTVKAFAWVLSTLGKSLGGIMKAGGRMDKLRGFYRNKFAKVGLGVGLGLGAAFAVSQAGGDTFEAVGAGVGATGGAMIGQSVGNAIAGPVGGALLGAAGGFLGGKAGQGIGKFLSPLTEPLGRFFKDVGKVFNDIMAPIQESLSGFFEALGGVMNGILDFIEPHMPMITKILGIGINTLFAPLFLGLKALTAVLKFFAPKGTETTTESSSFSESMSYKRAYNPDTGLQEVIEGTQDEGVDIVAANQHNYKSQIKMLETEKRFDKLETEARGLEFDPSQYDEKLLKLEKAYNSTLEFGGIQTSASRAKGGWINGPMSGYPVSLDGGRSTAFIGHGLEWVGSKMASGGAFVVPYNTPATKKDSGLTSRRFREAMMGGYALPTKAEGGEVEQVIGNVEVENKIMGQGFNIDIEELRKHQAQILRQLPEGTSIDDVIAGEVNMQHTQLIKILANSDAQRATHQRRRMEVVSKLKNNFANFLRAEPNEEGQATGWKRIYMGLADAYTGNKYDFDGRGDMLDGAEKLHTEVGNMIELAKLALVDKKNEILAQQNKVVEAPKVTADPIVTGSGGGGSFDVPINVDNDGAADPYLITRFGLVSEFNGDMADLM